MYISVNTFAAAIDTSRSLKTLLDLHSRLENFHAQIAAMGADRPEIADITSSIADSLSDAWGDSGASAYIDDADEALTRWNA